MTKKEWNSLPYYDKAWRLNQIIVYLNDESAYYDSGWLYIWPDGEMYNDCVEDFKDKDAYKDLEDCFKRVYSKSYIHKAGLYFGRTVIQSIVDDAHLWDKKLGLKEIEVLTSLHLK